MKLDRFEKIAIEMLDADGGFHFSDIAPLLRAYHRKVRALVRKQKSMRSLFATSDRAQAFLRERGKGKWLGMPDQSIIELLTTFAAQETERLMSALLSCKDFIAKNKRGNEYLWMEDVIDRAIREAKP